MNLREGTRRLALLLGIVGAAVGIGASYMLLQPVIGHHRFERLANSSVITDERESQRAAEAHLEERLHGAIEEHPPWMPTEVNKDGIKKINWVGYGDWSVDWIETEGGEVLRPVEAPARWTYWAIALFPPLGFLIPWGTVRAIGWVLAGFIQPAR